MVKIGKIILALLALTVFVSSCKTTESNYREAYDKAKTLRESEDSEVIAQIEKERAPVDMVVGADTMRYRKEFVTITPNGGGNGTIKRYNVVVGRFRQVFNAKSMRERMEKLGYDSYVIENGEPAYFVVVFSSDSREEAAVKFREVVGEKRIVFNPPFPWVLEPARYVERKENK